MQQLIYASRPFGFSAAGLAGILSVARTRNAQNDVTGALICRSDIYLQLLEGPESKVDILFENICQDDRHLDVQVLVRGNTTERMFPTWSMKHDPAVTWLWTQKEINAGALTKATELEVRSVFVRMENQSSS